MWPPSLAGLWPSGHHTQVWLFAEPGGSAATPHMELLPPRPSLAVCQWPNQLTSLSLHLLSVK